MILEPLSAYWFSLKYFDTIEATTKYQRTTKVKRFMWLTMFMAGLIILLAFACVSYTPSVTWSKSHGVYYLLPFYSDLTIGIFSCSLLIVSLRQINKFC